MRIKNYKIKTESHHLTTIALRFCSIIHDNTLTEIITSHISPDIFNPEWSKKGMYSHILFCLSRAKIRDLSWIWDKNGEKTS